MNYRIGYVGVLLGSMMLMACGGGSGASSDPQLVTPTVNAELSKYEGIWRKDCVDHMRLSMTVSATKPQTLSVSKNEVHFANADCTGDVVAIGNYGEPDETVQYTTSLENASILMPSGATVVATVDPGNSVLANARFSFTGPGVVASVFDPILGQTIARIKYAEKEVVLPGVAELKGQSTSGALLLLNDELYSLVPIENTTSSFRVNHRFFR